MKRDDRMAMLAGLSVAWGGVAVLISPAGRLLGPPESLTTQVFGQLVLWALLGVIVCVVVFWEKRTPASMGLRPFRWASVGWGLALAAAMICVVMPVLVWALRSAGIQGFESGVAKVLVLPLWLRIFAVLTAGVVEDALFLGYAFTRLTSLAGSYWLAGGVSVVVASLLHLPHWGAGPVMAYLVAGAVATSFFAWRRDLLANMVAHVATDAMALVVIPSLPYIR
jgi:membrane protease YdiL (CAAX protease family)